MNLCLIRETGFQVLEAPQAVNAFFTALPLKIANNDNKKIRAERRHEAAIKRSLSRDKACSRMDDAGIIDADRVAGRRGASAVRCRWFRSGRGPQCESAGRATRWQDHSRWNFLHS